MITLRHTMVWVAVAILCLGIGTANAGIIGAYVDADVSNTVATDGTTPWNTLPSGTDDDYDGLWGQRTDFPVVMEGDDVWAGNAPAEDVPQLTTTITGLTAGGFYNISLVFVGHSTGGWTTSAGLASDSLTMFYYGDGVSVTTAQDSGIAQLQAPLGTTAADASGEIAVYVDAEGDGATAGAHRGRSWYDGVAYAPIPEPTTGLLLILGLAGFGLFLRRR